MGVKSLSRARPGGSENSNEMRLTIRLSIDDVTAVSALLGRMTEWTASHDTPRDMADFISKTKEAFSQAVREALDDWEALDEAQGARNEFVFDRQIDEATEGTRG